MLALGTVVLALCCVTCCCCGKAFKAFSDDGDEDRDEEIPSRSFSLPNLTLEGGTGAPTAATNGDVVERDIVEQDTNIFARTASAAPTACELPPDFLPPSHEEVVGLGHMRKAAGELARQTSNP